MDRSVAVLEHQYQRRESSVQQSERPPQPRKSRHGLLTEHRIEFEEATGLVRHTQRETKTRGTLLCIPGMLGNSGGFRWAEREMRDHDILTFDFIDHWKLNEYMQTHGFDLEPLDVRFIRHLLDVFQPEYVLAQSWGGFAALQALASGGSSVEKACIACFATRRSDEFKMMSDHVQKLLAAGERDRASEVFVATVGERLPRHQQRVHDQYLRGMSEENVDYTLRHLAYVDWLEKQQDIDAERFFATLKQTTAEMMFVNGDQDRFTSADEVKRLHTIFPEARFEIIEGAGHFIVHEGRDYLRQIVNLFKDFYR